MFDRDDTNFYCRIVDILMFYPAIIVDTSYGNSSLHIHCRISSTRDNVMSLVEHEHGGTSDTSDMTSAIQDTHTQ